MVGQITSPGTLHTEEVLAFKATQQFQMEPNHKFNEDFSLTVFVQLAQSRKQIHLYVEKKLNDGYD